MTSKFVGIHHVQLAMPVGEEAAARDFYHGLLGFEQSYAYFGEYLARAVGSKEADIDNDGGTSLLEAFLFASKQVAEFFEAEGRIATEQALLDDNGDGFGTPAAWFRGVRAVKQAKDGATPDGMRAHQFHLVPSAADRNLAPEVRQHRDDLESTLLALRAKKDTMDEEAYFRALEALARQLAALYHPDATAPPTPSATEDPPAALPQPLPDPDPDS